MTLTHDPVRLFTERTESYARFVRLVGYRSGIRAYLERSLLLRSGDRVLDAGCGTGVVALALRDAILSRGLRPGPIHAFDLTPAMLDRFQQSLRERDIEGVETARADVLRLDQLPGTWNDYDLIVSASMLEYLPQARFIEALTALRGLLKEEGHLLLFITRRNWLTWLLIGRWWQSNLYGKQALTESLHRAGFQSVAFRQFPAAFRYLGLWGYVVEARGS